MGVKENLLMRRMSWMQSRPIPIPSPQKRDEEKMNKAIKMLSAIACLNSFFYDLETEFEDAGLFRHNLKRYILQQHETVKTVHELAHSIMKHENVEAGRAYNDKLAICENSIEENVLLSPPERAYNIVLSLSRLVRKFNEEIVGWYDFAPAEYLYDIPRKIKTDKVKDYNIDLIIEKAL